MEYLWDKATAEVERVEEYVWGHGAEHGSPSRLKSALHKLNVILKSAGVPWRYGEDNDRIVKETEVAKKLQGSATV